MIAALRRATPSILWGAARSAVTAFNRPIASIRFRRLLAKRDAPYYLHVGAGTTVLGGWIDTDASWRARYWLDVRLPFPLPEGSVRYLYADNVVEHLLLAETRSFFRNAFEVLMPGGVLRLATPDVRRSAELYLARDPLVSEHLERARARGCREIEHSVDVLRLVFSEFGHSSGYLFDFDALAHELRSAGFDVITQVRSGESEHQALRGIETRTGASVEEMMLVVEAKRPKEGAKS
jgi:predicted SAM-dependent methyltransferase